MAIGAAFLVAPDRTAVAWLGPTIRTPAGRAAMRAFAIRDVIIGAATLDALRRGVGARRLFRLAVLADAVDVSASLGAGRRALTALGGVGLASGALLGAALPPD